jgi:ketosteroid isomerase-like protein
MNKEISKNVKIVLDILDDEIKGDVKSALQKMSGDYSMTWVYKTPKGELFPSTRIVLTDEIKEMNDIYQIKDRKYDIKNIAEGKGVVMVEMIESYTDPKTKQIYRTPLVLVLEIKDNKIQKGRHYCDPRLSYENLSEKDIKKIF